MTGPMAVKDARLAVAVRNFLEVKAEPRKDLARRGRSPGRTQVVFGTILHCLY